MDEVDFAYVDKNGSTIYNACFILYLRRFTLNRQKVDLSKLMMKTEEVFQYLIEQGTKYGFNVDSILEIPNSVGETCFKLASGSSKKISKYIMGRDIKVNSITTEMLIPFFKYPDLAIQMMKKGINPYAIYYNGYNQIDVHPSSFKSEEAKQLLRQLPRSVHFSVEDINCDETCPENCPSEYRKFYSKNGELVKPTNGNRIGQGGFGSVFKGLFHGKKKAMKYVLTGKADFNKISDVKEYLEKNISEIRIQIATAGSGVIVPEAFVRQQIQEQDDNGKWIAKNYNVYIYPIYDCNLYELHENHFDNFTEEILGEIIHQCFNRKGFQNCHT